MTLRLAEALTVAAAVFLLLFSAAAALGVSSTLAVVSSTATVCGVLAGTAPRGVVCARAAGGAQPAFRLLPNVSFDSVSGGRDSLCGLRSGGSSFLCWSSDNATSTNLQPKRVYTGSDILTGLAVGDYQIAAAESNGTGIRWWRGASGGFPARVSGSYLSLTSGNGFSCAISSNNGSVHCWGDAGDGIQGLFADDSMATIVAGGSHVCGINTAGYLICKGSNSSGQSNPPATAAAGYFSGLALGSNHSCALRRPNGTAICWGGGTAAAYSPVGDTSFEFLVAGGNLTCGLVTANFSVICWTAGGRNSSVTILPLPRILPGICTATESSCSCGVFPESEALCLGSAIICNSCSAAAPPQSPPSKSSSRRTSKGFLAYAIVGSVGGFAGICTIIYCLWRGVCRHKKVHNSVQPTITGGGNGDNAAANPAAAGGGVVISSPFTSPSGSRSRIFRRQGSRAMKRQRSGPSSFKDRAEEFSFSVLADATKNFALETKIGAGSFGTVYKGKLPDGREVAIKRSESGPKTKKFQEKESAFQSELAFLSRLHHKHLVGFVGYCEEEEERLLVYEFMKNGALYDHLHSKKNGDGVAGGGGPSSSVLNSWKMRIKVLLDASRGIEYLHNYAVPPIIHRDIKSSNILLDAGWVAKVSDFGLSLMGPETDGDHLSMKAAGTVGYMDPEYYGLHHLTVKSDVYGLGVVMLEVLTGKRAIFREEEGGNPVSVVDYAVPSIMAGEVVRVLDSRVGPPGPHEAEALELVAYTAVHCVQLEGRERPTMTDIVSNLESSLALCEGSHGSISSASISLASFD